MKISYLLIVILTIQQLTAFSQTFEKKDSIQLKFDKIIDGQWADIDNDGLLNYIVLFEKSDSVEVGYFTIENDIPHYTSLFTEKCVSANFEMVDMTNDGLLDILISLKNTESNTLEIRANNDTQDFTANITKIDSVFTINLLIVDLTRNGSQEIVSIAEDHLGRIAPQVYFFDKEIIKWDTLSIAFSTAFSYSEFLNIDVNKDGWDDLLIAGVDSNDEPTIELYQNDEGKLKLSDVDLEYSEAIKLSAADLDSDGGFEIVFSGKATAGSALYYYEVDSIISAIAGSEMEPDSIVFTKINFNSSIDSVLHFFAADFNSDGFIDHILRHKTSEEELNQIMINDGNVNFAIEDIPLSDHQDFGDLEWDGDLDAIQFRKFKDSVSVLYLKNITIEENEGPGISPLSLAFPQGRQVTIIWDSVQDDHTNQAAITYDLYIRKEEVIVTPGFDIEKTHRTVVAHGNQSTLTSSDYYELESGVYDYGIQAVDNAFYAGNGSGDCNRGQFVICDSIETHYYIVCDSEEVILIAEAGKVGNWYSTIEGDLGKTDSLKISIPLEQKIYFVIQGSLDCADQEMWSFEIMESGSIDLLPDIWACEKELVGFEVGDFWKSIQWNSSIKGDLRNTNFIEYTVDQNDTINIQMESFQGCVFTDSFLVNMSVPQITLNGEMFRILRGSSVQLQASSGITYEWSPQEGLNNHLIPNPIASPEISTLYTVELTDSVGCQTSGTVQLIVESNAFIPNLFTPNQDQRNDVLKIYGLEEVNDFSFKIYNRSGSLVYESIDLDEVISKGWDGTKNGKEQPNGVYYWKVSGAYKNGDVVYLNGESSGAVHLLR